MPKQVIIDEPWAELFYYDDTKIIHHAAKEGITGEQWRTLLLRGNQILEEEKAIKWLSDNRQISALADEDSAWINEEWLPSAIALGWKFWALVVPTDILAAMHMQEYVKPFNEIGVRIFVFDNVEEALAWLEGLHEEE